MIAHPKAAANQLRNAPQGPLLGGEARRHCPPRDEALERAPLCGGELRRTPRVVAPPQGAPSASAPCRVPLVDCAAAHPQVAGELRLAQFSTLYLRKMRRRGTAPLLALCGCQSRGRNIHVQTIYEDHYAKRRVSNGPTRVPPNPTLAIIRSMRRARCAARRTRAATALAETASAV
jgi:hypothetical protein